MHRQLKFPSACWCVASILVLFQTMGCSQRYDGVVMVTDANYEPEVEILAVNGISSPDGMVIRDRKIFIADEAGSAIRVWDIESKSLTTLVDPSAGIRSPEDLVVTEEGDIYFSDDDTGGIWKYDGEKCIHMTIDLSLPSTEGIALLPDGRLLVGDGERHSVSSVAADGRGRDIFPPGEIDKPESFAVGNRGEVYIADNRDNIVYVWSEATGLDVYISAASGIHPESICFQNGTLFVTDSVTRQLLSYDSTSGLNHIASFGGELGNVQGVACDADGNVFVSIQTDLKAKIGFVIKFNLR